jgi:hypothetical protein
MALIVPERLEIRSLRGSPNLPKDARMSMSDSPFSTRKIAPRLGIIHLLGWMIGVGVVLAIFRATTDLANYSPEWLPFVRMQQLGFGIAYGTAISGLGLFLWRWWRGAPGGPSQPGHWLLVFGGLGLVIDLLTTLVIKLVLHWSGTGIELTHFGAYLFYQTMVWWMAAVVATIFLACLSGASRWWIAMTVVTALLLTLNSLVTTLSFYGYMHGAAGTWTWKVPIMVRIATTLIVLAILWMAEIVDRRHRVSRDWLHGAGVVAISGLGLVDFASNLVSLNR